MSLIVTVVGLCIYNIKNNVEEGEVETEGVDGDAEEDRLI